MIPLVVALWENVDFGGVRRLVVDDTPDLRLQNFNDKASAIGVHPGPDYQAWKDAHGGAEPTISLYQDINFGGAVLTLTTGAYADIHARFNFGDLTSSVRINAEPAGAAESTSDGAATIAPIPVVMEVFGDENFNGKRAVIVEDVDNVISYLGGEFNDTVTAVRVRTGPNFSPGAKAGLYRDVDHAGGGIQLDPGDYPNLGRSHGFNDVASSFYVRRFA